LTVIFKLPPAISIAHLGTSMAFFGLLIWIVALLYFTDEGKKASLPMERGPDRTGLWLLATLALVYLQIVLGAVVRHSGAGLACTEIPLCQSSLWPAGAPILVKIHMLHRLVALGVALAIFWTSFKVWKRSAPASLLRLLAGTAVFFVLLQISLGLYSVATALALIPVTAHLGLGALLLADLLLMFFAWKKQREREPVRMAPTWKERLSG
jgi:heme A synthase